MFSRSFTVEIGSNKKDKGKSIKCVGIRLIAERRKKASDGKILSDPITIKHHYISDKETKIPEYPDSVELRNENKPDGDLAEIIYLDRSREKNTAGGFDSILQKIIKELNWRYIKNGVTAEAKNEYNSYNESVMANTRNFARENDLKKFLNIIQGELKKLTGNNFTDLELSLLNIEQPFSNAFFAKRMGSTQIPVSNFGSGISILTAYLLLKNIAKSNKNGVILLIDEPELHLHPQLQQKLFEEFEKSDYQVIYTTHSDTMISLKNWQGITRVNDQHETSPSKEVLKEKQGDQTIEDHINDLSKYNYDKKIFYREDNQLFFAKKCLLVEGPNDKYGLSILAGKLNIDFSDLTIIACSGKNNIMRYNILCYAFNIAAFVIFDDDSYQFEDDSKKDNKKKKEDNSKTNSNIINTSKDCCHFFKTSFEKILSSDKCKISKKNLLSEINSNSLPVDEIPQEIKEAINAIDRWNKKVNAKHLTLTP